MKVTTRRAFPYMMVEVSDLTEINGVYSKEELEQMLLEYQEVVEHLEWAINATTN